MTAEVESGKVESMARCSPVVEARRKLQITPARPGTRTTDVKAIIMLWQILWSGKRVSNDRLNGYPFVRFFGAAQLRHESDLLLLQLLHFSS
jgi:hypothetical protein